MRQIIYESIHDVPHSICSDLETASFGSEGLLYRYFSNIKFQGHPQDGIIVVGTIHNTFVGWGALYNFCDYFLRADYTLMLYVHETFRKKGYGTQLANSLLPYADSSVLVWNNITSGGAGGFFTKLNNPKLKFGLCKQ